MSDDDNIFSRWSNRKRAVEKEERIEPAVSEVREDADSTALPDETDPNETEEEILARFGLPSPESLGPGDDYTGFMQSGVPEFLRRRALRRLWRSNPVLANVDGLNDYDEDFTSPEETMKVLKTAYKVGRGFLRDETETAQKDADSEGTAEDEPTTDAPTEPVLSLAEDAEAPRPADDEILDPGSKSAEEVGKAASDAEKPPLRPKRMRFDT